MKVLFNVKVSPELMELIDHAAGLSDAKTKSEWAREALEAGARAEIRRAEQVESGEGPRRLGGGFVAKRGECTHPPQGWIRGPFSVICSLCGAKVRRG